MLLLINRVVPIMEASVIVGVSSEHRRESLEAVSYAIDAVKGVATIWKKEIYADGTNEWKANKECSWS
jgi:molybdopterin synthase catalytic subunit